MAKPGGGNNTYGDCPLETVPCNDSHGNGALAEVPCEVGRLNVHSHNGEKCMKMAPEAIPTLLS